MGSSYPKKTLLDSLIVRSGITWWYNFAARVVHRHSLRVCLAARTHHRSTKRNTTLRTYYIDERFSFGLTFITGHLAITGPFPRYSSLQFTNQYVSAKLLKICLMLRNSGNGAQLPILIVIWSAIHTEHNPESIPLTIHMVGISITRHDEHNIIIIIYFYYYYSLTY